jgi:hypothetical protein
MTTIREAAAAMAADPLSGVDLTRRLDRIVTRCGWFGDEENNYTDDCDQYGPRRRIKWAGERTWTEIRLCSRHLAAIKTWDSGLVTKVSDHG